MRLNFGLRIFTVFLKIFHNKNKFSIEDLLVDEKQNQNIKPPFFMRLIFDCEKSFVDEHSVWTIKPRNSAPTNHILFLHGGAYVQSFNNFHWRFIAHVVLSQGCVVHAPNYPLAPENKANETIQMILNTYQNIISQDQCKNIIVMGDSAGGGLALALTLIIRDKKLYLPAHTILISPWLDIRLNNPLIADIDNLDPILNVEALIEAGKLYAGELPLDHPFVSPINGKLENLPPVSTFIGTDDILYPDCIKLKNELQALGNQGIFYEADQMMHDWVFFPLLKSLISRFAIFKIIRETFQ